MIIVVNPGGAPGHSFKGLSAYCSHDAGSSDSSERVAWTATRNIEAEPEQAWKVMAATAGMAETLKSDANVQSGRKTKLGPVMHMVVSFVDGEPTDQKSVERQIDGMLGKLGVDPAQMRSKSKPKRRQFADEHQVQMWAHEDTSSFHVHLSINTVHPEHGTRLPTSNNFRKLQRWALGYTKAHGTDHHTPAREENVQARRQGEYVKHPDRPHRKAFDASQRLEEHLGSIAKTKAILKEQKAKDRAVYEAGRAIKQACKVEQEAIEARYLNSLADAARLRRRDDNKAKAEIREQFRPVWRDLADKQVHELETFEALEASFFGRTKNVLKAVRQTGADDGSNLARAFRIISNANDRRKQLEVSQTRERIAVQSRVDTSIALAAQSSKAAEAERLSSARNLLKEEMTKLRDWRAEALAEHGTAWRKRNAERRAVIAGSKPGNDQVARPGEAFAKASAGSAEAHDQIDAIIAEFGLDFEQAAHDARDILNEDQSFNGKQKK